MGVVCDTFGLLSSGERANLYTLKAGDLKLTVTNYGGTLVSLFVPSKSGRVDDVLLGYSTLDGFARSNGYYLNVTVGRFANRIGKCAFNLNGKTYSLYDNMDGKSLHGGRVGFDRRLWEAQPYEDKDGAFVRLTLHSPSGEEGYPGNLTATVRYGVTHDNRVIADYAATLDADCPVNLTNHAYFNLSGEGTCDILAHELKLYCSNYMETQPNEIPTGKLLPVKGTPLDFTTPTAIGKNIKAVGIGYDHCYTVDGEQGVFRPAAEVADKKSGRTMKISTTQPAIQFYTGNHLDGLVGKNGSVYTEHHGFCLETQHYPDSPNQSAFPSAIFGPARPYHEHTEFTFGW
jgi:aldose 1-epimerase